MNKSKVLPSLMLVCFIVFSICLPAYAFILESGYMKFDDHMHYYYSGYNNYSDEVLCSVARWNMYTYELFTHKVTSIDDSDFRIRSGDFGNTSWVGRCYFQRWWTIGPYFIHLNEYHLGQDEYAIINTTLHELGHMYGIDHNSDITSVLYPYLNPDVQYPNEDDIAGVDSIY